MLRVSAPLIANADQHMAPRLLRVTGRRGERTVGSVRVDHLPVHRDGAGDRSTIGSDRGAHRVGGDQTRGVNRLAPRKWHVRILGLTVLTTATLQGVVGDGGGGAASSYGVHDRMNLGHCVVDRLGSRGDDHDDQDDDDQDHEQRPPPLLLVPGTHGLAVGLVEPDLFLRRELAWLGWIPASVRGLPPPWTLRCLGTNGRRSEWGSYRCWWRSLGLGLVRVSLLGWVPLPIRRDPPARTLRGVTHPALPVPPLRDAPVVRRHCGTGSGLKAGSSLSLGT